VSLIYRYDVRASDHDRERVVEFLKAHYADGRLEPEELAWRTDAAYRAVGLSELDRLTADLPAFASPRPRRRRVSPLALAAVALCLVALLVAVPPETWLLMLVVLVPLLIVAGVLIAPIAIPMLFLAGVAYAVSRALRPRPPARAVPPRVGWR
jgi:hypothetical protein